MDYITAINNYDTRNNVEINAEKNSLILPGIIKNTSGTVFKDLLYELSSPTSTRPTLNNLIKLTTLPNVFQLTLKLSGAPNLRYFNLMDGLLELNIEGTMTSVTPNYPDSSKLINFPSSFITGV